MPVPGFLPFGRFSVHILLPVNKPAVGPVGKLEVVRDIRQPRFHEDAFVH
jgi:hypothetical protein